MTFLALAMGCGVVAVGATEVVRGVVGWGWGWVVINDNRQANTPLRSHTPTVRHVHTTDIAHTNAQSPTPTR